MTDITLSKAAEAYVTYTASVTGQSAARVVDECIVKSIGYMAYTAALAKLDKHDPEFTKLTKTQRHNLYQKRQRDKHAAIRNRIFR